jgi:hypothetical protein
MMYQLYMIILIASFLASLISFPRGYAPHLRLFSFFLGLSVATEIIAWLALSRFHARSNYIVYSVFMLFEYCLYALFFRALLHGRLARRAINTFLVVFPLIWAINSYFIFGMYHWNSYTLLLGDAFTITLCVIYFYQLFTSDELRSFSSIPEFWIAAATFIFSCCELPITGMLNYLAVNYEAVALWLKNALQLLNILMYLIIIVAYLLPLFSRPPHRLRT